MKDSSIEKLLNHGKTCSNRSFSRKEKLKDGTKLLYIYTCDGCGWKMTEQWNYEMNAA